MGEMQHSSGPHAWRLPMRRYKDIVDDEEADKMDRLLGSMQKKDELQQRGEAITQLSVSSWHCITCDIITERRKPACQVIHVLFLWQETLNEQ